MAEYIEREALLKDISESVVFTVRGDKPSLEIRGANKVIDRIKSAPAADVVDCPKWISVKEKLPEENVRVLVWLKENDSYTRIDTDRLTRSSVTFWVRWGKYVTHWCPIPESLKEGAEE